MPLRPPSLDDRSFDDLVQEVVARIPAHTPEWTNPRIGDPGRTLIDLFAWLTDTLLYRANLIPERQRLAFLRLLGARLRPATPARGLVNLVNDEKDSVASVTLRRLATLKGPVNFETRSEITVLPVSAEAYYKRPLARDEKAKLAEVLAGLQRIYLLDRPSVPYATTPVFSGGASVPEGFDLISKTIDSSLWLALLAPKPELVSEARKSLGENELGGQQIINIGVMPAIKLPALFETVQEPTARVPHVWEISTGREIAREPEYLTLDVLADTTSGLTRRGVVRLQLPNEANLGALNNDVRRSINAGLGDRPPRLDDAKKAARLICWIRLRPTTTMQSLSLSWVGINAVEIDGRQTITNRVVGQSDGAGDQEMTLSAQSVEPDSLELQVEERGRGYRAWRRVDDLATAGRDDGVYSLDAEAGTVRFGDGVRGRIPEQGCRVRVGMMRAGGGRAGNLPPGSLTDITARDLRGAPVTAKLKVQQSLPTTGGEDAENLAEAERRIPALFRHRDRAVTEEDYKRLAADTPGIRLGRVEVLPRFKPQQRRENVPGVVSVMVLPFKEMRTAPNPLPDRFFIESVHGYLDKRRPLTTELYVIGCEYVPLGLSCGCTIRDGFGRDTVINDVRDALRRYLWPLPPGGSEETGWQLGRPVSERELEIVVARVAGVSGVVGINLFEQRGPDWQMIRRAQPGAPVVKRLRSWQLPELLSLVVVADAEPPTVLRGAPNPFAARDGVAVPVVPEVC